MRLSLFSFIALLATLQPGNESRLEPELARVRVQLEASAGRRSGDARSAPRSCGSGVEGRAHVSGDVLARSAIRRRRRVCVRGVVRRDVAEGVPREMDRARPAETAQRKTGTRS